MNAPSIQIRRLLPDADTAAFRAIRLEALQSEPDAFGSTFAAENARPLEAFAERLASSAVFGAFDGTELVGIAGLRIQEGTKDAHKALLWGMYVRPVARKSGVGRRLIEALVDFARGRVEQIQLSVVTTAESARRLYTRLGFVEYGLEKNALKQGGRYFDEILMVKHL